MEKVVDVIKRDHDIIIHIGKDKSPSTRFFLLTPELAEEVRDILNDYLENNNE